MTVLAHSSISKHLEHFWNKQLWFHKTLVKLVTDVTRVHGWCEWGDTFYTVRSCYNAVNFLENPHKRHPIARLLWRGNGCLLCTASNYKIYRLSMDCHTVSSTPVSVQIRVPKPRYDAKPSTRVVGSRDPHEYWVRWHSLGKKYLILFYSTCLLKFCRGCHI